MSDREETSKTSQRSSEAQSEYVRGGKGRKDEVGKSGIYPASSPDAPADSVLRVEGELVGHAGAPSSRKRRQVVEGDEGDVSGGSE